MEKGLERARDAEARAEIPMPGVWKTLCMYGTSDISLPGICNKNSGHKEREAPSSLEIEVILPKEELPRFQQRIDDLHERNTAYCVDRSGRDSWVAKIANRMDRQGLRPDVIQIERGADEPHPELSLVCTLNLPTSTEVDFLRAGAPDRGQRQRLLKEASQNFLDSVRRSCPGSNPRLGMTRVSRHRDPKEDGGAATLVRLGSNPDCGHQRTTVFAHPAAHPGRAPTRTRRALRESLEKGPLPSHGKDNRRMRRVPRPIEVANVRAAQRDLIKILAHRKDDAKTAERAWFFYAALEGRVQEFILEDREPELQNAGLRKNLQDRRIAVATQGIHEGLQKLPVPHPGSATRSYSLLQRCAVMAAQGRSFRIRCKTMVEWLDLQPEEAARLGLESLLPDSQKRTKIRRQWRESKSRKRRRAGAEEQDCKSERLRRERRLAYVKATRMIRKGHPKKDIAWVLGMHPSRLSRILKEFSGPQAPSLKAQSRARKAFSLQTQLTGASHGCRPESNQSEIEQGILISSCHLSERRGDSYANSSPEQTRHSTYRQSWSDLFHEFFVGQVMKEPVPDHPVVEGAGTDYPRWDQEYWRSLRRESLRRSRPARVPRRPGFCAGFSPEWETFQSLEALFDPGEDITMETPCKPKIKNYWVPVKISWEEMMAQVPPGADFWIPM